MKRSNIFWGVCLILIAVLLIVNSLGVTMGAIAGVSVLSIILGVAMIAWIVTTLVKHQPSFVFFPLAFLFMLFEKNISTLVGMGGKDLINNWLLLLCALLLCIGTGFLTSRHHHVHCSFCKDSNGNTNCYSNTDCHGHLHETTFAKTTKYIDCSNFTDESIEVNMGACDVLFENPECYAGNAILNVDVNMGSLRVIVPADWDVVCKIETHLGKTDVPASSGKEKILHISGDNNMGNFEVVRA